MYCFFIGRVVTAISTACLDIICTSNVVVLPSYSTVIVFVPIFVLSNPLICIFSFVKLIVPVVSSLYVIVNIPPVKSRSS